MVVVVEVIHASNRLSRQKRTQHWLLVFAATLCYRCCTLLLLLLLLFHRTKRSDKEELKVAVTASFAGVCTDHLVDSGQQKQLFEMKTYLCVFSQ